MCIYDKPEAGFYSNRGLSLTNTQLPLQSVSPSRRSQLKGPWAMIQRMRALTLEIHACHPMDVDFHTPSEWRIHS